MCHYSDVYILIKGAITVVGKREDSAAIAADRNNKQVTFKNCALITNCISGISNIKVDNKKDLDVLMPNYSSLEYI